MTIRRVGALLAVLALVATPVVGAAADASKPPRTPPQGPAAIRFGPGFPVLQDSEWHFRLGGFGGLSPHAPLHHVPVILVHGNNVDAADWYPVRDDFRAAGWTDQEVYALSYNGLGANNGTALKRTNLEAYQEHAAEHWDGNVRITEDEVNVPDLYAFITAVQSYTGQRHFTLVTHSLGVTLARETLRVHPELRQDLVAFVGIAGGNHGTSFCPPGSEGQLVSCDEIAAGTPWLARLNAAGETYGPARWLTVYDGSGAGDPAYAGPDYAQSPALAGAENRQYPGTYHNDLRIDADIVADYRRWIEQAERPYLASLSAPAATPAASGPRGATTPQPEPARAGRPVAPAGRLAATGPAHDPLGAAALTVAGLLALAAGRRRRAGSRT